MLGTIESVPYTLGTDGSGENPRSSFSFIYISLQYFCVCLPEEVLKKMKAL